MPRPPYQLQATTFLDNRRETNMRRCIATEGSANGAVASRSVHPTVQDRLSGYETLARYHVELARRFIKYVGAN